MTKEVRWHYRFRNFSNRMSHTYDLATFDIVIDRIQRRYLTILGELYERLSAEAMDP